MAKRSTTVTSVLNLACRALALGLAGSCPIAGLAAAKSYYFQRCNHDRALPYAGDALGEMQCRLERLGQAQLQAGLRRLLDRLAHQGQTGVALAGA